MTQNIKESTLRKKLNDSGKKLSSVIWGWVDVIEHDLSDGLSEKDIGMEEFISEVEELLEKNDCDALVNSLKKFANKVNFKWRIKASRELAIDNTHWMFP